MSGFLVSSAGWGSALSLCDDGCTCVPWAWLIFFEAMTVADNLLKGNYGSVYNDHGLISHSDLEGSHFVCKVYQLE